jgi:multidrug efflux pump subunit AcrA (membrane-fusion protein)
VAATLGALLVALVVTPKDLELAASGKLQPSLRREVFAPSDGVVEMIFVDHGSTVRESEELMRLRNTDLEVEISKLVSQKVSSREQVVATEQNLLRNSRLTAVDRDRLATELMQLREYAASLDRQLDLHKQKQQQLSIKSDRAGEVITWKVRQQLDQRPVQRGQTLLTIADRNGPWELELNVPERRMGYISTAAQQSADPLRVVFTLSTFPDREYEGRVVEIHQLAETVNGTANMVRIRVSINKSDLPQLHHGTTVHAKIHGGRRSLGFVMFHDLFEAAYSNFLFWI